MAQQNSFDVVSQVDLQEVDNAVNQAIKEIIQRYDFKGTNTTIELSKKDQTITINTSDDFHLRSVVDSLQSKFVKRNVPLKAMKYNTPEEASGGRIRQVIKIQVGIDKENAKLITKLVKETALKVQAQIMDDQVRVMGKNKDDLQAVIQAIKQADLPFAVQFVNYR